MKPEIPDSEVNASPSPSQTDTPRTDETEDQWKHACLGADKVINRMRTLERELQAALIEVERHDKDRLQSNASAIDRVKAAEDRSARYIAERDAALREKEKGISLNRENYEAANKYLAERDEALARVTELTAWKTVTAKDPALLGELEQLIEKAWKERDEVRKQSQLDLSMYQAASRDAEDARQQLAAVTEERDELFAWKQSALAVESEWDAQAIARSLGATLGQSVRKVIAKRVPEILAQLAELSKDRERLATQLQPFIEAAALVAQEYPNEDNLDGIPNDTWPCRLSAFWNLAIDAARDGRAS